MVWVLAAFILLALLYGVYRVLNSATLSSLPDPFVLLALETTDGDAREEELVRVEATRIERANNHSEALQVLIAPSAPVSAETRRRLELSQARLDEEGKPLNTALAELGEFISGLPIVVQDKDRYRTFVEQPARSCRIRLSNDVRDMPKVARDLWRGPTGRRIAGMLEAHRKAAGSGAGSAAAPGRQRGTHAQRLIGVGVLIVILIVSLSEFEAMVEVARALFG